MADSIKGDGLLRTDKALAALVENPELLDRARGRFSESPPSYRSHPLSHNSTLSPESNPLSEEQQRREEREWHLKWEREASFPYNQFKVQKLEEIERIDELCQTRIRHVPLGVYSYTLAEKNVKERWIEQGIWNNRWNRPVTWDGRPGGKWKHEEPLEPESESETDSEADPPAPPQGPPPAIDTTGLPNGDVNHSSAASDLQHRHAEFQDTPRSPLRRTRRQGERGLFVKGGLPPQIERNALGPVHPSMVSKARKMSGPGSRRQPKASEFLSDAQQALSRLDVPAALPRAAPVPPRRSRRLQEAERKPAADSIGIAATGSYGGGSQSRLRRTRAGPKSAESAKAQGISKSRPSTARRRRR